MVNKNDDVFREAIWEVYNKRCFYNRELIQNIFDINIDHMLPDSLTREKLEEIIENYELEPDYDLNAIYNLVLACSKCNSLKTNFIPDKTTLLNNLTITKSREPLVKEKMDEIRKNLSKLRLKSRLGAITRDEIDERKISMLKNEMNEYIEKKIAIARDELRRERSDALRNRFEEYDKDLKRMSIDDLIKEINDPTNSFIGAAREYTQRIFTAKNEIIKIKLLKILKENYLNRPRGIFCFYSTYILLRLLNEGLNGDFSDKFDLKSELETLCLNNINYWNEKPLRNAVCHLDNITLRLGKSFSIRLIYDHIEEKVNELSSLRSKRENLKDPITISDIIISYYGKYADIFWNDFYNCNSAEQIWDGVWLCQKAETELNDFPIKANLHQLDEMTMFESYGGTFDMYCYGTWDLLNRFPNVLTKLDNRLQEFARIARNNLRYKIHLSKTPLKDWILPLEKYKNTNIVQMIKYLEEHKIS